MLVLASVTESLVNIAWHFVRDAGLPAVFVLMVAESACIPIPSEATMLFAGFAVADPGASAAHHHLTLAGIVAAGVLGNLVGSWIAYGVGRAGRLELVERHGHWLHVKPSHLEWADRWFARYGAPAIFFSRMLPIVRTFISLPAGVAKMPFWRFTALTIAGCIPWVLALALVGQSVGSNWEDVRHGLEYVDYVIAAAFVAGAVYAVVRWRRGGRTQTGDTTEATTPGNSALGRRDRAEGAPDATPAAEADLDATPATDPAS
ncbi:MAG TPA: DedA family protein [Solirubrobacteraceae bacterium]|nr:DedA family protein [Solirubrobacteraceae bacterium]